MELRNFLFAPLKNKKFGFTIRANQQGLLSGSKELAQLIETLPINIDYIAKEGTSINEGTVILRGEGEAEAVASSEEKLLGVIGKPSGVATSAANFVRESEGKIRIVCGAWKKVVSEIRPALRQAIATGGAGIRITDEPFIYLDKNYVRMLGSVGQAVRRAKEFSEGRVVSVQIKGEQQNILQEALEGYEAGAGILMVDTGHIQDLKSIIRFAQNKGWRQKVKLAFGGGARLEDLPKFISTGADIIDVGRGIIDAPMIDFSFDVTIL
ncbi:nicotinate-nucleotide pyrophosphorylase [Desulforamulus aquiferis]|uniref:Nicotinate-nucleotide pyrophosphorylase n=1 Tax=Desulforamulus aquiferis TaxID=1397668 RepID=A0AAW7ZFT9_9FIRM|nr:nicotinate-nucleotide pyrophosphorylase [Desulforamulus aquiferis]MDO7788199.1 nicotinate-nucleotide pyrophosphorylase [Desulforamulus aquiferis]